jgi:hypothetical protein
MSEQLQGKYRHKRYNPYHNYVNGEYSIVVPDDKAILTTFSFVSYTAQIIVGNKTTLRCYFKS